MALKGTNSVVELGELAAAEAVRSLARTTMERPSGVSSGKGGELCGVGELVLADAGRGDELGGLAVAEGDGAGLVEEQGVDVAGGLDGAARHGEDVVLDEAIHARDADGREQAADGRGDQADEERDEDEDRLRRRSRWRRAAGDDGEQEDDGEPGEQDVEGDLVRGLLALGAFDESDHAVEEGFAGVGGDADLVI